MIRRAPGLKLVVGALIRSLKPIGNIVLIAGIFFVVFGVLGVQVNVYTMRIFVYVNTLDLRFTKGPRIFSPKLFKGRFYHCDGDEDVVTKQECLQRNVGKWVNRPYNFDDLAQVNMMMITNRGHLIVIKTSIPILNSYIYSTKRD